MKRIVHIFLILILLCSLFSGCRDHAPATENVQPSVTTTETTQMIEQTEDTEPVSTLPYLQKIPRADQSIFAGPSYDHPFAGTVEEAGTYTIVEEAWDEEGNLWGKLKSGAGWVDLTQITAGPYLPLNANFADNTLLQSGVYHHCVVDISEYTVQIAFRAQQTLTNFTLSALEWSDEELVVAEGLCMLETLKPDKPLVADVAFPGDMSMFGISFTDSNGVPHRYTVSISGRNGSLVLAEYDS